MRERMLGEDRGVGAALQQMTQGDVAVRARQHRDGRGALFQSLYHLACFQRIGKGQHGQRGPVRHRLRQNIVGRRVSADGAMAGGARRCGAIGIGLDDQQRHTGATEQFGEFRADPAVTDDQHMAGGRRCGGGIRGFDIFLCRDRAIPGALAPSCQNGEHQRIERDRQDRAGQHQIARLRRHQVEGHAQPDQDEGELADLRQTGGDGQRDVVGLAQHPHDRPGGQRFAHHDDRQRFQHLQRMLDQDHRVEQHAD